MNTNPESLSILNFCLRTCFSVVLIFFSGCSTTLYVPMESIDGKIKSVKVAQTYADAKNLNMGYTSGETTAWVYADQIIHSEPTRAGADVVRASGTAAGSVLTSYFGGRALLEGVRGNTAKNLDQGKTTRHKESQVTSRQANDNATKVKMAEVGAGL